jgi:hypothetical protein
MNRQDDELMFKIRELPWTEICQHLLEITKRLLLSPSICNCLSAELTTMLSKLRIEKYASAWTGSWQWENRYVIGSSQPAVLDCPILRCYSIKLSRILFWDVLRSGTNTLQKLNFWEQASFQRRVLFLDSCYVLMAIATGTRYDEHEFHSGSLILSTHWFGSRCDAAVQVEFSFECIPGICGWTSVWVQNGRPNHLTNNECMWGDGRRCESKMNGRTIWWTWVSFGQSDTVATLVWLVLRCSSTSQLFPFGCVWGGIATWGIRRRESKMDGRTIQILYGLMQHESEASWHVAMMRVCGEVDVTMMVNHLITVRSGLVWDEPLGCFFYRSGWVRCQPLIGRR